MKNIIRNTCVCVFFSQWAMEMLYEINSKIIVNNFVVQSTHRNKLHYWCMWTHNTHARTHSHTHTHTTHTHTHTHTHTTHTHTHTHHTHTHTHHTRTQKKHNHNHNHTHTSVLCGAITIHCSYTRFISCNATNKLRMSHCDNAHWEPHLTPQA